MMWRHSAGRGAALLAAGLLATVLVACGADDAVEFGGDPGGGAPTAPEAPEEADGFDPERSRELAEGYLGVAEEDVEETMMVRILRRGEERFAGTMDLRPGRFNLELDADEDGVYRVSRVVVETAEGEDLVVE